MNAIVSVRRERIEELHCYNDDDDVHKLNDVCEAVSTDVSSFFSSLVEKRIV